ncbi:uncharacterized protein LOC115670290 [Syzygium oleosum]|uniref:uncharacterized protein LOC115670290 n=1 Tax=Syzygium oleosum TaxID=219896 RepID=UPI0024BB5ECA|nr:uncharacterized protein LOC115670290 [Syzygium oleosum]
MSRNWVVFVLILVILCGGFSSASATPAKILGSAVSNVVSALVKWLWSLQQSTSKPTVPSRSMMKFESGYTVETVFDGSKLGIEPHSVEVSPSGELMVLDSANSNLYRMSFPLSRYSRPKLIAGSPEGYSGHVDGKTKEARMSHPKGLTVDNRGNIYIADTMNMAIRKISDTGMSTIAGGKWGRGGGHIDGPSEEAKFSDDFDVVYVGSSCSLLIVDRGNQAIREIQLHDDDCSHASNGSFHLGIAVLVAAGFFGYMLALLQQRVKAMFSSQSDLRPPMKKVSPVPPYQRPPKSVRPPLIPPEEESEVPEEEGLFSSIGRLVVNSGSSMAEIFSGSKRKPQHFDLRQQQQQQLYNEHANSWPMQESFAIPDGDEPPPPLESRTPNPKRTYPFMSKEIEKSQHFRQSQGHYGRWVGDYSQQQQQQQQQQQPRQMQHHQQHHHRHYSPEPNTYYERSCETNEIVFGAVQEQDGRREAMVIKAVDYADPRFDHRNIRPRINYMGYSHGY